ncbi:rod shape-determining protein MreD [Patescibacteria group bacterium]|nr:rod shape-determining protein MreD [Patescibacteria group bacterium]
MFYKPLILIVFFYFISLIQNSFLVHFSIFGVIPNLVLILVCLFIFFEKTQTYYGLVSAVIGGFFLDIFSGSFIGISTLSLIIIYFLIKEILCHLKDIPSKYLFLYFIIVLIFTMLFYELFFGLSSIFLNHSFPIYFGVCAFLVRIIYNLIIGLVFFYIFKRILIVKK